MLELVPGANAHLCSASGCLGSLSPPATYKGPALLKIGLGITENPLQNLFYQF